MDTSAVIQLSCQAAESVLRFRAVGFTRRPSIDLQSFRAAITVQIEKVARDHRHRFEVPLSEVVTYAGIGAARAAQQWNDIAHKENRVAPDWFRNCVCNLVSGVVSDIGQMAFEDQGMNACMYLEPDQYDPFEVSSYTSSAPFAKSTPYVGTSRHDYYGFPQVETQQNAETSPVPSPRPATFRPAAKAPEPAPLRHEVAKGYKALEQLAASHDDNSARADFIQNTKRLRDDSEPISADSEQETLLKRSAKRACLSAPSRLSRPSPLSAGPALPAGEPVPKIQYRFWTEDEVNILVTAREFGRSWGEVSNMLPRHTWQACQSKYRVTKNKDGNSGLRSPTDATAIGEQGRGDAVKVLEKGTEAGHVSENEDKLADEDTQGPNATDTDIDDHDRHGNQETPSEAGSSGAPKADENGGEQSA